MSETSVYSVELRMTVIVRIRMDHDLISQSLLFGLSSVKVKMSFQIIIKELFIYGSVYGHQLPQDTAKR